MLKLQIASFEQEATFDIMAAFHRLNMCFGMLNRRKIIFIIIAFLLFSFQLIVLVYIRPEVTTRLFSFAQTLQKPMRYMWKRNTSKFTGQENQNVTSTLPWNETTLLSRFVIVDSVSSIPTNPNAKYVLVIPRRIKKINGIAIFALNDQQAATIAGRMMDSMNNLDGLACSPRKFKNQTLNVEEWKGLFNTTWCNFARREWSIQIRNSGRIEKFKFGENHNVTFQMCNLVNGPLVLRKEKFVQLNGLRPDFGRLSLLDFFLRSNGTLKIGKFGNCFYSDELFNIDRGPRKADEFPEYSHFGVTHGVLRIIKEDGGQNRMDEMRCYE